MFKNYLKIALRNLTRNKSHSLINIGGLAVGMASVILILLWVQDELSYDKFHKNSDDIYRIVIENHSSGQTTRSAKTPNVLGAEMLSRFPEIVNFTRFLGGYSGWLISYGEKLFTNDRWAAVDPAFFEIFSFTFTSGDPKTALTDQSSIVITEEMAKKYFGEEPALGKIIKREETDLKVTGVIRVPPQSHLQFDYAVPIVNMKNWWYQDLDSWAPGPFKTYVQLAPHTFRQLNSKVTSMLQERDSNLNAVVQLQPLREIYLQTDFEDDGVHGNATYVYISLLIGLCILCIASINFVNLTIARSAHRNREVGVRKVLGAKQRDIIIQFMGETFLITLIALLVAFYCVQICIPEFNGLVGKHLSLDPHSNHGVLVLVLLIGFLAALLSGGYPSFYLASQQPLKVVRNQLSVDFNKPNILRKLLVMFQFTVAIALFISAIVIYSQLTFMRSKDVGFDKENIIFFAANGRFRTDFASVKSELLQQPFILKISRAFPPFFPAEEQSAAVDWEGKNPDDTIMMLHKAVDYDYLDFFNLTMAQGRFFSREHSTDASAFVINETAAKAMGLDSPIGKRFSYNGREGRIIGVLRDFHQESFHTKISPFVFEVFNYAPFVCIKLAPDRIQQAIAFIEKKWSEYVPDRTFSYRFFDEFIDGYYQTEKNVAVTTNYFTFLALIISCLGLYGLAAFTAKNRTKEIGIRKVLGATIAGITAMLAKDFTKWVLLANFIAWPIAWYAMNKWLQNFAYRIDLTVWPFLLSGLLALLIALLTVSWQAIRAARANPVESLRYE